MKEQCEFYPGPNDGCVCAAGSDVSGPVLVCTEKYSWECQWAIELRKRKEGEDENLSKF